MSGTATGYARSASTGPTACGRSHPRRPRRSRRACVDLLPERSRAVNGTVIVEWLNVTGGLDIPAIWMPTQRHLLREGYTWVGVSAQAVSVHGGGMMPGLGSARPIPTRLRRGSSIPATCTRTTSSPRSHVRSARSSPLARHPVDRMFATGRVAVGVPPHDVRERIRSKTREVFDGFLIGGPRRAGAPVRRGSRSASSRRGRARRRARHACAAATTSAPTARAGDRRAERDRRARRVHVRARPPPDTDRFRLWEVAGSAHSDTYFLSRPRIDTDAWPVEDLRPRSRNADEPSAGWSCRSTPARRCTTCSSARSTRSTRGYVTRSLPPTAPRLEVNAAEDGFVLDELGVARGRAHAVGRRAHHDRLRARAAGRHDDAVRNDDLRSVTATAATSALSRRPRRPRREFAGPTRSRRRAGLPAHGRRARDRGAGPPHGRALFGT